MNRSDEITKYLRKDLTGIEVAPYFRPILSKSAGYKVITIDVFDTAKLREMALNDPNLLPEWADQIEKVDIVGDASNIADMIRHNDLSGKIEYIVSSHNFEHLPNPVKFLQGCSAILNPGGILSMAVPDYRACFDHFRMPTRLSDWLSAFHENRSQPNAETVFDGELNLSSYLQDGSPTVGCDLATGNHANFAPNGNLLKAYSGYLERLAGPSDYRDTHCTVMFPETLELLLRDVAHLGLIDLEVVEVSQTTGLEFYVHLRKPIKSESTDNLPYEKIREELLRKINISLGAIPYILRSKKARAHANRVSRTLAFKSLLRTIIGKDRYENIRAKNRSRKTKL